MTSIFEPDRERQARPERTPRNTKRQTDKLTDWQIHKLTQTDAWIDTEFERDDPQEKKKHPERQN